MRHQVQLYHYNIKEIIFLSDCSRIPELTEFTGLADSKVGSTVIENGLGGGVGDSQLKKKPRTNSDNLRTLQLYIHGSRRWR